MFEAGSTYSVPRELSISETCYFIVSPDLASTISFSISGGNGIAFKGTDENFDYDAQSAWLPNTPVTITAPIYFGIAGTEES